VTSPLNCHDNIEAPLERAGLRDLPRSQGNDHAAAGLRVTDAVEDSIPCVEGFALNGRLGNQTSLPRHMHGKVDVGVRPGYGTSRMVRNRYRPCSSMWVRP
jgi:hypothetical protein